MICAVTTFASSIINYTIQVSEWENGSWHGNEFITSYETYKKIADSDAVKDTAYLQNIAILMTMVVKTNVNHILMLLVLLKKQMICFQFILQKVNIQLIQMK